jgi:hypothetical protein
MNVAPVVNKVTLESISEQVNTLTSEIKYLRMQNDLFSEKIDNLSKITVHNKNNPVVTESKKKTTRTKVPKPENMPKAGKKPFQLYREAKKDEVFNAMYSKYVKYMEKKQKPENGTLLGTFKTTFVRTDSENMPAGAKLTTDGKGFKWGIQQELGELWKKEKSAESDIYKHFMSQSKNDCDKQAIELEKWKKDNAEAWEKYDSEKPKSTRGVQKVVTTTNLPVQTIKTDAVLPPPIAPQSFIKPAFNTQLPIMNTMGQPQYNPMNTINQLNKY